jgi:hypothetical protein
MESWTLEDLTWAEEFEKARLKKHSFYHPPLPKKKQRTSAYDGRGRPRKVKIWSSEEVAAENERRKSDQI